MDCFCCFLTELLGLVLCSLYDAVADIHGYGCFIREDVKKGEFLAEYCGEILTHEEARRRELCGTQNVTFYHERNKDYMLDAMRKGSVIRFANCRPAKSANMYNRICFVNAEHRCAGR